MDAISLYERLRNFYVEFDGEEEWAAVYSALLEIPDAPYTTFIKLGYFRQCKGPVQRFQEIPDEYKTYKNPIRLFVSHKWQEQHHPDESGTTRKMLLDLTQHCDDDAAVWWDYCSLPQRNSETGVDDRSPELKDFFKYQLSLIPLVLLDSQCMFLWSEEGVSSGWCCVELLIAQAVMQNLNKMIYGRKHEFKSPPLFVTQAEHETVVESDLARFDHTMVQKIYCSEAARKRHNELIVWMNEQLTGGVPMPYSQVIKQVPLELIVQMVSEKELTFTNGADSRVVAEMLFTIYRRLSFEPFNSFKWSGRVDFFPLWHYVRGCFGNCLVPKFAYWF